MTTKAVCRRSDWIFFELPWQPNPALIHRTPCPGLYHLPWDWSCLGLARFGQIPAWGGQVWGVGLVRTNRCSGWPPPTYNVLKQECLTLQECTDRPISGGSLSLSCYPVRYCVLISLFNMSALSIFCLGCLGLAWFGQIPAWVGPSLGAGLGQNKQMLRMPPAHVQYPQARMQDPPGMCR